MAQGRARFRDRFKAHQSQQAKQAADEVAARELVGRWDRVVAGFDAALPRMNIDPAAFGAVREALLGFGREVREQPAAAAALRQQGEAFGMEKRPNLARVLADARPELVVGGIVEGAEAGCEPVCRSVRRRRPHAGRSRRIGRGRSSSLVPA